MKTEVCKELNDVKTDVHSQSLLLSRIDEIQQKQNVRLNVVESRCSEIEHYVEAKNKIMRKELGDLDGHVERVEHDILEHVETIKNNVQEKVYENENNQKHLEQRLLDFTVEIDIETRRLRMDMDAMQKKMSQLKCMNAISDLENWSMPSNSTSKCSHSCSSKDSASVNEHSLYMFGDTQKTLIVDHIREYPNEKLLDVILNCVHDINIDLASDDIIRIERIGRFNPHKKWPRPVKVVFRDRTVRDQIYYFKSRLKHSEKFSVFKISKEKPRDMRVSRAKLRMAADIARYKGLDVYTGPESTRIEGTTYTPDNVDSIPMEYTVEGNSPKKSPPKFKIPMSFYVKCRKRAEKIITVGPSLQKTIKGLAFSSENCFLSNFFACTVKCRGYTFVCTEQGYQFLKAKRYNDEKAMKEIMDAKTPVEMKRAGGEVVVDESWDRDKFDIMEELLLAKFWQNTELYNLLMNTRPYNLIESTLDSVWGSGCKLGSIALIEGIWEGENHLGKMLMYIQAKFEKDMCRL